MEDLNIPKRIEHLLKSSELSDCVFKVENKRFKAHRLILSTSSPVFRAMLNGVFDTKKDVLVTDIEPNIFQLMLDYIYTDKVDLDSIDQAFSLISASKKYLLKQLTKECLKFMEEHTNMDNALTIFTNSSFLQEEDQCKSALKFILQHAETILNKFLEEVSEECMQSILESNYVNMDEIDLIIAAIKWSQLCCRKNKLSTSIESQRQVLVQVGFHKMLRFRSLSYTELEKLMFETGILPTAEYLHISTAIGNREAAASDDVEILFSLCNEIIPRVCKERYLYTHYNIPRSVAAASHVTINRNQKYLKLRILAHTTVRLKAFSIPTQMLPEDFVLNVTTRYSEKMHVLVSSEDTGNVCSIVTHQVSVEYNSFQIIEFKKLCVLEKDKWYIVSFIWPMDETTERKYKLQRHIRDTCKGIEWEIKYVSKLGGSFIESIVYCFSN